MVCYLSLALAFGFMGASLMTMIGTQQHLLVSKFMSTLNFEQQELYKKIVEERFNLYMQGQLLGLLFGCIYLVAARRYNVSCGQAVASFLLIVMATQYFYYTLMPKKEWMVDSLTTQESMQEWLNIYKYMKRQYHVGFLIGAFGYGLIAYAFSKRK
jgi:hypothetical protein